MERSVISLPLGVSETLDSIVELLGFKSREDFIVASVKRTADDYNILIRKLV